MLITEGDDNRKIWATFKAIATMEHPTIQRNLNTMVWDDVAAKAHLLLKSEE